MLKRGVLGSVGRATSTAAVCMLLVGFSGCDRAEPKGTASGGSGGATPNGAGAAGHAGTPTSDGGLAGTPAEAGADMGGAGTVPGDAGASAGGETTVPVDGGAGGAAGATGGETPACSPACDAGQSCVASTCKDQNCPPSANFCAGNSLRTCDADGFSSVEVTACPADKYCAPDSPTCKSVVTGCPNLYLGSGRFGARPRPALRSNDAILLASYDVPVNTAVGGQVRIDNLGTDDSPSTHVELYITEATGNFPVNQNGLILETNTVIPGSAIGSEVSQVSFNWLHTFTTVGRYVLLARVENNGPPSGAACVQQGYDTSSPATDPLSAVHYINVTGP